MFAEDAYHKEIEAIEGSDKEVKLMCMSKEEQARSEKLYAILVGLLRNRPLKLLRAVGAAMAMRCGANCSHSCSWGDLGVSRVC